MQTQFIYISNIQQILNPKPGIVEDEELVRATHLGPLMIHHGGLGFEFRLRGLKEARVVRLSWWVKVCTSSGVRWPEGPKVGVRSSLGLWVSVQVAIACDEGFGEEAMALGGGDRDDSARIGSSHEIKGQGHNESGWTIATVTYGGRGNVLLIMNFWGEVVNEGLAGVRNEYKEKER
ncbi:unnamed protein product [Sphenostylis stenocarpa]|uniref:Uncharacterized protein n=1 Tax=Sphenostylis stenocarpa TaxID=92480 RepID=A0AA86SDJ6_9FABA|nr:unnamed protein product [Sphenostylis stenocarpa]